MSDMPRKLIVAVACLLVCEYVSATRELKQSGTTIDPWTTQTYKPITVPAGSTLVFWWTGQHSVWSLPSGSCLTDWTDGSNGLTQLAATSDGGSYTTRPLTAGTKWYSCSVDGHCAAGQLLQVNVT